MSVCVYMCVSVAGQGIEAGGCNRKASGGAGSHFVDLVSLAAERRSLERMGSLLLAGSTELILGLS